MKKNVLRTSYIIKSSFFYVLLLVGAIWFIQPADVALAGINDDLVSYWKYNEGVDDTCVGSEDICDSQGGNHGERAGTGGDNNKPQWLDIQKPTLATNNPYTLDFDGVDDEITGIGDINFSGNAFSVSTWVYPDNWGAWGDAYIHNILCDEAGDGDPDVKDTTFCFRIGSKGQSGLRQKIALMIHNDVKSTDFESTTDLALDTWTHVAVTWDGTNVKFYINGYLDRTQAGVTLYDPGHPEDPSIPVIMNDGTLGFRMGSAPSNTRYFDGGLDELRLYDRALTTTEINELATINPGVSTLLPIDDATGVGVNDDLVITFDKNMQAVGGNNIYIKKISDDSVVETIAADDAKITITGAIVTINPTTTLDEKTEYYVNIDSGAFEDSSNNEYSGMSGNESWNFTTEDTTNPTVQTYLPADEATDVATNSNFSIEFDEIVNVETGEITIYDSGDIEIEAFDVTTDVTGDGTTTINLDPTTDLFEETSYYVQIAATAIDDAAGNSFAGILDTTSWSFTTADETAPSPTIFSPLDDYFAVELDANLSATFDEIVFVGSGDFTIKKGEDDSIVEVIDVTSEQVTGGGTETLTFNPSSDFEYNTDYYIFVDASTVEDSSGNPPDEGISDPTAWSFTTVEEPEEDSSGGITSSGSYAIAKTTKINTYDNPDSSSSNSKEVIDLGEDFGKYEDETVFECSDVEKEFWAYEIIQQLLDLRLYPVERTSGEVKCKPATEVTRASFTAWLIVGYYPDLMNNFDSNLLNDIPFSDLTEDNKYAPYIMIAYSQGIINGHSDGTFKPDESINRAELLKITFESLGLFNSTADELNFLKESYPEKDPIKLFEDINDDESWFYTYLYYATANDIIIGRTYTINGVDVKRSDMALPVLYAEAAKVLHLARK